MRASKISVQDIDHSGIVAGIIDQMGLVEQVNQRLGQHPLQIVSPGQAVKAMILNGLGFVSAPLYLFEQFFVGKATEHLIGEGIQPEHLNDDRIGRVLDELFEAGLTEVFVEIALSAAKRFGVATTTLHLDSSSFHVDGKYACQSASQTAQMRTIAITHGYSRDHRPDLKQFVVDLMCSGDGDIPLYLRVADGNEADKAVFAQLLRQFKSQLNFESLFVADSALYCQENLYALSGLRWLSRVPATLSQAKERLQGTPAEAFVASRMSGYRMARTQSQYAGVEQRWLVVESEARKASDLQHLGEQVAKHYQRVQSQLNQLSRQAFACEADARGAANQLEKAWRYHCFTQVNVIERVPKAKRGRPRKDTTPPTQRQYFVQAILEQDAGAIAIETQRAGRFILATNVLDPQILSDDDLLGQYKAQQSTERGFRFLKDPLFFTSSVFLKSPHRVAALAMVMGLCLLVYSLGQRLLRHALSQSKQSLKNQLNKPTQMPTLRWIFQCFQSVHLVTMDNIKQIANLTEERQQILRFLGAACQKYYLLV
ncbi:MULTISPECIES: IS1634 family transposase [Cyanophyceae]|uniref:IS1634 family transposase n=1 Tax=Cyanophyceae TaxID=3028117 RepID=UPI0016848900|nr:IS1634 family transposase [Trichocoleus sp. FACHB-40]MBD2005254.1 IS1634 family transposase [Trichocoleus sp. FACHB-40]